MDPPPPPSTTAASTIKLRIMCSYGGHIVPRPQTKSLCYLGGDTRIISVPAPTATATISAFISHVSDTLHHPLPFSLKYQLPHHDLDSLVSLSTDEDLQIMLEEHQRLSSNNSSHSRQSSRIRLFLFLGKHGNKVESIYGDEKQSPSLSLLQHPKTESWFVDALKSARMIEEGLSEGEFLSGGSAGGGGGLHLQESMVLETSSSFESTSSSASLSNFPATKAGNMEENVGCLQESKIKLPSTESVTSSDNSLASGVPHPQVGNYQDPTFTVSPAENRVSSNPFESESIFSDPSSGVQICKTVQGSGYPVFPQVDQPQLQPLQFVQMGPNYITQHPTSLLPVTSYYPTYNPVLHQQPQQLHYQPNQPYPIYIVPVQQPQLYNVPTQCGLIDPVTIAPLRPPVHPSAALLSHQVAYKEVTAAPPVLESASQFCRTNPASAASPLIHVPYNENQQPSVMHHQPQPIGATSTETTKYSNEVDEEAVRAQIYKSQPPPPALPSQYQTMTKATTLLLSDALAQLHMDNINQM